MNQKFNVLVIEDSEVDYDMLVRKLTKEGNYQTVSERVHSLNTLKAALDKQEWDIIISDHSMPQFSALNALQELKDRKLDIPVIILSGTIEPSAAIAAMKAGASDYIMKDDMTRLLPAIERELREAKSRCEKRLAEDQFHQAQKMESIGKLAGGVAHDFNNILTAIMGYANFLAGGPTQNETWREDVDEIRKAAERAAALTRQLLAFSRRQALQLRVVDLNAEFTDLKNMLRRLVGEDIEWTVSLASALGYIKADPGQIQQVLMNLVVNAKDAMPNGGTLAVSTENVKFQEPHAENDFIIPPGAYVAIVVSDTGVGIDENIKTRIFEPFFTTKEKGKGTGLGLAVIYGIVKQAGGYIVLDSAPEKGTTFKIYFPTVDGVVGAKNGHQAAPESYQGTETILVVDDDEAIRAMLRRVLRQHGYATLEAGSGEEALKLVQAHKGNLHMLLTDMVLPGINGLDLARQISSIRTEIKIVLISGYLDKEFGNFSIDEKTPFLQKPFAPDALAKLIREVLDTSTKSL